MNLKHRIVAIATTAAIALPAVALAAKYSKDDSKESLVEIKCSAAKGAIPFTAKVKHKKDSIFVTEGGGNTNVKIDGFNLKTGMDGRDKHMKDMIFKDGRRYVEVVVPTDKIDQGLKDGKINAVIKFGGKEVTKTITDLKKEDGFVKGAFTITTHELGLGEVCKPIDLGILKFDKAACVTPELKVSGAIAVK